jgi:hypothetical protein
MKMEFIFEAHFLRRLTEANGKGCSSGFPHNRRIVARSNAHDPVSTPLTSVSSSIIMYMPSGFLVAVILGNSKYAA